MLVVLVLLCGFNKQIFGYTKIDKPQTKLSESSRHIENKYKVCFYLSEKYNKKFEYILRVYNSVEHYSDKYGMSVDYILALICQESNFRYNVPSRLGAKYGRGLCQVSELALTEFNWHNVDKKIYIPDDLYVVEHNIEVACWYINRLEKHYNKGPDMDSILSAYNRGPNDKIFADCYVSKIKEHLSNIEQEKSYV